MHGDLTRFKRNINQLFEICVDILNVGRSLQHLSQSMHMLANNGVVQAARVGGGKGRPMLALVEILNHTPKEIRPEVRTVQQLCASLAKLTASSSGIVWRYHQLVASLLVALRAQEVASGTRAPGDWAQMPMTTGQDLLVLMRHPLLDGTSPRHHENLTYIASQCQDNLSELHQRFRDTLRCLGEIRKTLAGLKMIGMTTRYIAFCIATEAASLSEAESNFKNLSVEITHVVDDLDSKTVAMKRSIDHGQELLELLLKGQVYAQ